MSQTSSNDSMSRILAASAIISVGVLLAGTFCQTCLSSQPLSSSFISPATWHSLASFSNQPISARPDRDSINIPFWLTFVPVAIFALVSWMAGGAWLYCRRRMTFIEALIQWGWYGWLWWSVIELWEWLWIASGIAGWNSANALLSVTPQFWLAGCLAGWLTTLMTLDQSNESTISSESSVRWSRRVWIACAVYIVVFTAMNWLLYFNLLIPHGDSAMYEEHLWNLLHGKGFRSYLDRGLFFGEHIQFVHLFLLPLYVFWPSHLLLEACSSTCLALGAFPVYWMAKRHSGSDRTALAVSIAYLLYTPMQALDIEIDLKTFRPESFGIPLLLLTLDQLDRKSLVGTLFGIAACLTVKEDYSIIFGPLGVWIAFSRPAALFAQKETRATLSTHGWLGSTKSRLLSGMSLSVFSVAYLWLATRVIMPWFRKGVEVHYASYFARFGKTPEEIVRTIVTQPSLVFESLINLETALYAIALLAPLAFMPLLAPLRLAVGLPLFGILCLNELERSRSPQHQFHAPLVAILFWTLAAALPRAQQISKKILGRFCSSSSNMEMNSSAIVRNLVWTSAFTTGLFFSLSPLGTPFWDLGSTWSWQKLYLPGQRAATFPRIQNQIPSTARVASTDFVHPRFTHYERSYDYSDYQRAVNGEGRIPADADYIVIDTQHRYSKIKNPNEVPEYRDHPEIWELLPDETQGYFIVLKRKREKDDG